MRLLYTGVQTPEKLRVLPPLGMPLAQSTLLAVPTASCDPPLPYSVTPVTK